MDLDWLSLKMDSVESRTFVGGKGVGPEREVVHTLVARATYAGQVGYGFAWTFSLNRLRAIAELVRELAPMYETLDEGPEALWREAWRRMANLGRIGLPMQALAVLDMAAWDAHARAAGLPMHEALGYPTT